MNDQNLKGQAAPDFELADTAGELHTLKQYAGRQLLMVFHRHLG